MIELKPAQGQTLESVCADVIALSRELKRVVCFTYDGVTVVGHHYNTVQDLKASWDINAAQKIAERQVVRKACLLRLELWAERYLPPVELEWVDTMRKILKS